ncbi:hypothetical protein [Aurantibacillus circumpalustris]|uniref:hypothetical protein n=1 Tax=Aurantibacillus circumpalustris TaxID=3036359 RepID=UPI00295B6006|nr:hypothetical protein [Aurantibacillus circumpalustris]
MSSTYTDILPIEYPGIPSAGVYYFTTKSGLRYEVRFGRLQDNILHANIVFGVINDEFEGEEYITTNRGEVYQVMNTIVEIVKNYMKEHTKVNIYEFNAVGRDGEDENTENARMALYRRFLPRIFSNGWNFKINGNFALVTKA